MFGDNKMQAFDKFSSVLVDYSALEKTLNDIFDRFEDMRFMDLCVLIEGIVLYDKLVIIGKRNISFGKDSNYKNTDVLIKNGVAVEYSQKIANVNIEKKHCGEDIEQSRDPGYSLEDAWYETKRLIGAEKKLGIPALRLEREKFYYSENALVNVDNKLCFNLYGHYSDLSEALKNFRKNISSNYGNYDVIPVPPLPLILFERMSCWDKKIFWDCLLELRDEYQSLRKELINLKEIMSSPQISPLVKKEKYDKWVKIWNTLNVSEKYKNMNTNLILSSVNFINFSGTFTETSLKKAVNADKLVKQLFEWAEKEFYSWKIRLLHETSNNYVRKSDYELNQEIVRLFQIKPKKLDKLHNYKGVFG